MTDTTETPPNEHDTTEVPPVTYPDTTVGMLMRQRDEARASVTAARDTAARYEAMADTNESRATSLQVAIDSMGGDEPMVEVPL